MQLSVVCFFLFTLVTFTFQLVWLDCGAVAAKWLSIEFWCMCLAYQCMLPCVAVVVSYVQTPTLVPYFFFNGSALFMGA